MNYIDSYGLLSSRLHRRITKDAIGWSWSNEWGFTLPGEVQRVDAYEGTQLPENAFWHHMRNGKTDEDPDLAVAKYLEYVNISLAKCTEEGLARALHAVQDSFAPGHEDVQAWMGGMPSFRHIFGDVFPGANRYDAAVGASKNLLSAFKSQCSCE